MQYISDYDYHLPQELIAQVPAPERSQSRLLLLDRKTGSVCHKRFCDVLSLLEPGDALVLNNTKVIPARVEAVRETGGRVEIFCLEMVSKNRWKALAKPTARLKEKESVNLCSGGSACLESYLGSGIWIVSFNEIPNDGGLSDVGRMPLPHYINRERDSDPRDEIDRKRYQTIFSGHAGAVAAPTAGLHFTDQLLDEIENKGITIVKLCLHVGVGTFAPVREDDFTKHAMHEEQYSLSAEGADIINRIKQSGGRIVAVGTTSTRVLETMASDDGKVAPGEGKTGIFIYPPYRFKAVDLLITNFHLPKSTLMLLVSAFSSKAMILNAYKEAIEEKYRFFSYGDAMLIGDNLLT